MGRRTGPVLLEGETERQDCRMASSKPTSLSAISPSRQVSPEKALLDRTRIEHPSPVTMRRHGVQPAPITTTYVEAIAHALLRPSSVFSNAPPDHMRSTNYNH